MEKTLLNLLFNLKFKYEILKIDTIINDNWVRIDLKHKENNKEFTLIIEMIDKKIQIQIYNKNKDVKNIYYEFKNMNRYKNINLFNDLRKYFYLNKNFSYFNKIIKL